MTAPEWEVVRGDCLEVLRELADGTIDSVITDPPYELGFMGKKWDATGIAYSVDLWTEVLRVLKPGGHLLAFGGTRTYHRMACAIEDAGFEIRDSLHWIYGTGFPKSLDVSKAIDKDAGHWRGKAGSVSSDNGAMSGPNYERTPKGDPVTAAAAAWKGWGTALKPAHEPVVMARKPLEDTVAANVQEHGTGAINVDGCRIEGEPPHHNYGRTSGSESFVGKSAVPFNTPVKGRWPANVLFNEIAAADLDAQVGMSAARFFYVSKPSRTERDAGLEGFEVKTGGEMTDRKENTDGLKSPRAGAGRGGNRANSHPTVKPINLMRYLVRLVTPPGGTVLDPFTGSGTTGCAAVLEGFNFLGLEREEEYARIARARIEHWSKEKP